MIARAGIALGQAWLRSGLAALAIAAATLAVAFFAGQIQLDQSEMLAGYEAPGAAGEAYLSQSTAPTALAA